MGDLDPGWLLFDVGNSTAGELIAGGFTTGAVVPPGSNGIIARFMFSVTCPGCQDSEISDLIITDLFDDVGSFNARDGVFTYHCSDPPEPTATILPSTPTMPPHTPTPVATATPTPLPSTPSQTFTPQPNTPTPDATNTPVPNSPTRTAVPPSFTPTPMPTISLGVTIDLPPYVSPGDSFWVTAELWNSGSLMTDVPVCFILQMFEEYWFWPEWKQSEFSYRAMAIPGGMTPVEVLPIFTWPDTGTQSVSGLMFYGAMLTENFSAIQGAYAAEGWSYGP